jgi:xanthine dehydrogenase molybdopterin-binding subunit B
LLRTSAREASADWKGGDRIMDASPPHPDAAGALTSVMNAIADALSAFRIRHIDMPATPEKVWQAIQAAGKAA